MRTSIGRIFAIVFTAAMLLTGGSALPRLQAQQGASISAVAGQKGGANRALWVFDDTTAKVVKYDMDGRFQYAWGSQGEWPGAFFNMHGASVDQEGNLYVAEVGGGRVQKFRPRAEANPAYLIGPPVYSAWK